MMTILFARFPELKKAYELKESYIHFNETSSSKNAEEMLAEYSGVAEPPNPEYGATSYPVMRARHSGNESHEKNRTESRKDNTRYQL